MDVAAVDGCAGGERSRLLIVRVGAMGDVLHSLPAVAALRRAEPERWIEWAIDARWRALLASSDAGANRVLRKERPLVHACHVVNVALWKRAGMSRAGVRDVLELRRGLRRREFALCVDLQGSIRSAVIGRLAGATRFVGSAAAREAPARVLYGERVGVRSAHVVEQACELLGGAVGRVLAPAPVTLPRSAWADAWAAGLLGEGARGPVLLAPTAGWGAKEWPPERFGAVAAALAREGLQVLVNAAAETDATGQRVVAASGGAARLVACSLEQLVALTRRCGLVIAGDTGPLHLAAALRVPVVGLYGPTDPARTGPWGTRSAVLRDGGSVTDHRRHAGTEAGLLRIGADDVVSAAREMLAGG